MGEVMAFPKTLDEFMQQYKIVDTEQVYTNGTELVPIFRIKQWEDAHQQQCEKCVFKPFKQFQPERKKWEWVKENIVLTSNPPQYQWHCSECGKIIYGYSAKILTDFCPNCGANMIQENDNG